MTSIREVEQIISESIKNNSIERGTFKRSLYAYIFRNYFPDEAFNYTKRVYKGLTYNMFITDYQKAKSNIDRYDNFCMAVLQIKAKVEASSQDSTIIELVDKVKEFRNAFGLKIKDKPSALTKRDYDLHYRLGKEELNEYLDACEEGNKVEILDALVDRLYILIGTFINHGMDSVLEDAFNEVHASNMSKLDNGKPIYREDGKVLKSSTYFKPSLERFVL